MVTELRLRNQAQQIYVRALAQAWRSGVQLYDPSLWLLREPELEEKMLRDADIAHAVEQRKGLIAGRQWNVIPRVKGSTGAPMAVHIATELLNAIKHFSSARLNLSRAFFSGARFARIHGAMRVLNIGDGKPRTWWVPIRLEDLDKRMYRIVPKTEEKRIHAHWEQWNLATCDWDVETMRDAICTVRHVYQDDQASLGYGRGLREALGWWWYAKEHVFQESLQAVERFAQGIITAQIDGARTAGTGMPNTELINAWRDVLEDLRSRHVLVYDSADKIETVRMNGDGWQLLQTMREELRSTIFTLILGANLTTSANKGGSYALAKTQENSTEARIQYDREIMEETLTDDLLGCIWHMNYANLYELRITNEKPRFSIKQERLQDPQERATVASTLNGMGVQLATLDILEQTGFRKPEDGEATVEGRIETPAFGDLSAPGALDIAPVPEGSSGAPSRDFQNTALNGAQVQAAAEIIISVVHNTMPPGTAKRMLVSMFNLDPKEAAAMVDEAVAFVPAGAVPEPVIDPVEKS